MTFQSNTVLVCARYSGPIDVKKDAIIKQFFTTFRVGLTGTNYEPATGIREVCCNIERGQADLLRRSLKRAGYGVNA